MVKKLATTLPDPLTSVPVGAALPPSFEQILLQAWGGQLNLLQLFEAANALAERGQAPLAAVLYQTWLRRNRTAHDHLVNFNLGVLLFSLGDLAGALEVYSRALQQAPDFLQPRFNLGLTHERLGNTELAVSHWQRIVNHARVDNPEQRPFVLLALNNLGRHYEDHHRLADALDALTRSLQIEPMQPDVIHHWVFLRAKQCVWPVYQPPQGLDETTLKQYTSALAMVSLSEDPAQQLAAAQRYVKDKLTLDVPSMAPSRPYKHKKLRIGYCSSDFCLHPVAMLTVELFELHDRDKFEVYGFDWSRDDGSGLRARVMRAFDHFERIHTLSDHEAAQLIRRHEIDILVDLQGQTLGARANMLAYRPAPVQITYLGLPATTGLPFIDYVIADRFLVPESATNFYTEKPLYMPDVYQVCDRQRQSSTPPSRASLGLPEQAFVFCCFNNNYKFTPEVFASWMNILRRTPGSVLWLLSDNPWAQESLQREAMGAGIAPDRLVFATRALPPDYLARLAVADLFLDSYPFNAGTTANDALFMGLPVLTRSGQTFASRMAGALLTAAGLPELITYTVQDYENKAVELASDPQICARLKQQLAMAKAGGVLFDTPRFVRNLEAQLLSLPLGH
ncbi:MAG: tetratricopeptide repeat protein [Burkholderiales bacterium]|nr:tetratricopeptide repeat protein [Burkholderiales bacterium]